MVLGGWIDNAGVRTTHDAYWLWWGGTQDVCEDPLYEELDGSRQFKEPSMFAPGRIMFRKKVASGYVLLDWHLLMVHLAF